MSKPDGRLSFCTELMMKCMCVLLNVQVVKLLVEKGADINEKDQEGLTALINAAEVGGLQIYNIGGLQIDGCHG